jgi:hypothetical protein
MQGEKGMWKTAKTSKISRPEAGRRRPDIGGGGMGNGDGGLHDATTSGEGAFDQARPVLRV